MKKITKRQEELLGFIYESLKNNGYPPDFDEIKEKLNISSNQAVIDHLNRLEHKGFIKREEKAARGIKITPMGYELLRVNPIAPFLGISHAGPAIETISISGTWKELSKDVNRLEDKVYLIKITGDSMLNAGILDGDQLLVKEQKEFVSGDIVVAQTPEGTTVKRFISQDSPPYLCLKPENPKYKIIYFTEEITLQGKVIGKWVAGEIKPLVQRRFL